MAQLPSPSLVAQEGDVVYLAVPADALEQIEALLLGPGKGGH